MQEEGLQVASRGSTLVFKLTRPRRKGVATKGCKRKRLLRRNGGLNSLTEVSLIEVEPVAEPIPANEADRDGGDHVRSPRPEAFQRTG